MSNYNSTISVVPAGKGSKFDWVGHYDAKGASDADAKKAINGVYEAGAKSITGH